MACEPAVIVTWRIFWTSGLMTQSGIRMKCWSSLSEKPISSLWRIATDVIRPCMLRGGRHFFDGDHPAAQLPTCAGSIKLSRMEDNITDRRIGLGL